MFIFTTHTAYNGLVGIVESGEVYELKTSKKLHKEFHLGAIYYRAISSAKRKKRNWKATDQEKRDLEKISSRAKIGQHTGNIYFCETCENHWLENFLNNSKLERWAG